MGFKVVQGTGVQGVSDHCQQAFRDTEIEYQFVPCATEDDTIAAARDADVLILVPSYQSITRRVIEGLPNCKYVLGLISGYDNIDIEAATEHGILVSNMPDLFYEEVADHTMALLLACSRKIVDLNQLVKAGGWVPGTTSSERTREIYPKLTRLQGLTLGLIGFGRIGRSVAIRAKGFGMRIITYDPYLAPSVFDEFGVESVGLEHLLRESDFVSVVTPLSDETCGMLGLEEFRQMKPTAYIINTGRGPIINRDALYTALTQGLIEGAALDVTEPEPSTPENNPLVGLENVIMTPHAAGRDRIAFANLARLTAEQVLRFARREWPHNLVNPEVKDKYIQRWGAWGGDS